jgi:twitching motility protein PilJ
MATKPARGRARTGLPVLILVVGLITLTITLGYIFYTLYRNSEYDRASVQMAADVRSLVERLSQTAAAAALGDEAARQAMLGLRERMDTIWRDVEKNLADQLPPARIAAFGQEWRKVQAQVETIAAHSAEAAGFRQAVRAAQETTPKLRETTSGLGKTLIAGQAATLEVDAAYSLATAVEQMTAALAKLSEPGREVAEILPGLREQQEHFAAVLSGLRNGDAALNLTAARNPTARLQLAMAADSFRPLAIALDDIQKFSPGVIAGQKATAAILASRADLVAQGDGLATGIRGLGGADREILPGFSITAVAIAGVGLLVAGLAALAFILITDTRRRLRETARANQANQDAILRLLDEIQDLGQGDLTVEATVTQDFTGAIADAINYSIQQLRKLVARIVATAEDISAASDHTRTIALQLSQAAENQSHEITDASAAINEMAITIDQVSANATESAAVAERSVSIAARGAAVVRNTITGMDRIRDQIQETSKRIKRLGESSQEIGDIVSLIGDIADQTNILALNAAIQASMAGDAGRGFAVVADEVQRLAERSASATKQIAALVAAIQSDTTGAVASMEQTTAEVVAGAALSLDAGVALGEIETVSTNLAELIQDISTAARHQSTTAGHISNTMNVIQEITSRTLEQANQTAASIGELADLAIDLRESVAGFRLPEALQQPPAGTGTPAPSLRDPEPIGPAAEARRPPPHIRSVLADSKAALDAIDRQRERPDPAPESRPEPAHSTAAAAEDRESPGRRNFATRERQPLAPATRVPDLTDLEDIPIEHLRADPARAQHAQPQPAEIDLSGALHQELAEIDLDEFDLDPNADYSRR